MELTKQFLEKIFSTKRMERYFALYPDDEAKAIRHYECNLMLAESLYVSLSVLEVTLRNALCRELETMTGREDWYAIFPTTPGLRSLNRYVTEGGQHITARHEQITPSKIVAELTLGFWVSIKCYRAATFPMVLRSERAGHPMRAIRVENVMRSRAGTSNW